MAFRLALRALLAAVAASAAGTLRLREQNATASATRCPPAEFARDVAPWPDQTIYQEEASAFRSYMHGSCMARRRTKAAQLLLAGGMCRRVAEIGGLLLRVVDDPEVHLAPELYANIDPSATYTAATRPSVHTGLQPTCVMDLPLTTGQFAEMSGQPSQGHTIDFDCVVVLGAMPAQFEEGAMRPLLRGARLVVIEEAMTSNPSAPCQDCGVLRGAQPLLRELGFRFDASLLAKAGLGGPWRRGVSGLCEDVLNTGLLLDCRNSTGPHPEDSALLVRQLAAYTRH